MLSLVPLTTEDGAILADIHGNCFPDAWDSATFDQLLKEKITCGWMATSVEGTPAGFILARGLKDEAEILTFAVCPPFRRAGIGRDLIRELLRFLTSVGIKKIFLEVAQDNEAAICLYESLNFNNVGTRPKYYKRPDNTFVDAAVLAYINE